MRTSNCDCNKHDCARQHHGKRKNTSTDSLSRISDNIFLLTSTTTVSVALSPLVFAYALPIANS